MILILIIIITQENSPQNSYFRFTSYKPLANIKFERKEINMKHSTLTYSSLFTLSSFFSLLHIADSGNMRIYVKMHTSIYANIPTYVRMTNSKYTNILTFNRTQIYVHIPKNNPHFRTKI